MKPFHLRLDEEDIQALGILATIASTTQQQAARDILHTALDPYRRAMIDVLEKLSQEETNAARCKSSQNVIV